MSENTKYIFITGGVVSSLGKGLASASLASLLQARGFKVRMRKLDPYLNVDPGTMSPYQHGEVFVTDDGAETDLDENWTASFGFQRTQYGFDDADMSDTNFNNSNFSLGFGGAYKVNDLLKINFGYYHTFYDEHEVTSATGVDVYTRKNDVVGVSLDFKF